MTGVRSIREVEIAPPVQSLLQRCVEVFREGNDLDFPLNLYLVLRGVRPGTIIELEDQLDIMGSLYGDPPVAKAVAPLLRKMESAVDFDVYDADPEYATLVDRHYIALAIEYGSEITRRIRNTSPVPLLLAFDRGELYVVSPRLERALSKVLMRGSHDETLETFHATAELLGLPLLSAFPDQKFGSTTVYAHVEIAERCVRATTSQKDTTIFAVSLFHAVIENNDQGEFMKEKARLARKVLVGQHFVWKGLECTVTDVVNKANSQQ